MIVDISSGDISEIIFRRIISSEAEAFSFDGRMLSVLVEVDGRQSLKKISEKTGMEIGELRDIVARCLELKLVEPLNMTNPVLDGDFYELLKIELCRAVGPIAEVLIQEAVSALGRNFKDFPEHQIAELVEFLAREIRREKQAICFKKSMIQAIKERGHHP